jgi:hypothetical protein
MNENFKIIDLKFNINNLVPKNICKYFINFYENNLEYSDIEASYKYESKKIEKDNFKCIDLTKLYLKNKKFKEPLDLAKKYIEIIILNYVFYIKKNVCSTFNNMYISKSNNIRILKYEKGQCIKDHSDCDVNGSIRASCTLNLNEDYEGGEFRFFNGRIKHSFKTGDAMIFPAEPIWIHGTEPITKGTRYSINCFLQS